jgi:hypothetical protein
MEWNEFVTFIIEQCSSEQDYTVHEKLSHIAQMIVQPTSNRAYIKCSKYIDAFGKILEAVGSEVLS